MFDYNCFLNEYVFLEFIGIKVVGRIYILSKDLCIEYWMFDLVVVGFELI